MIAALALLLAACGGDSPKGVDGSADGVMPAADMSGRIKAMEDSLFSMQVFDRRGAQALVDVYGAFAKAHPLDTMTPEYLFRSAGVLKGLGRPEEAMAQYDRIIKDYSGWERLPDTYYMRAFTIDGDLRQKGAAKEAYEEVIDRFPDHPFARDARAMIDNLQYTDEELIERFKRMNEGTEAAR